MQSYVKNAIALFSNVVPSKGTRKERVKKEMDRVKTEWVEAIEKIEFLNSLELSEAKSKKVLYDWRKAESQLRGQHRRLSQQYLIVSDPDYECEVCLKYGTGTCQGELC